MLMERLFSTGVMKMGPSRVDPQRQVGVFNPGYVSGLPELRAAELDKFRWLIGEWNFENGVPATRVSPAYGDIGVARFSFSQRLNWICMQAPDGAEIPQITFDPFSRQWVYLLMMGSYGMLRSPEGWFGDKIEFTGSMTMIGVNCLWRMRWTREGEEAFSFINEECTETGEWAYIDEWRFKRPAVPQGV